MALTRVSGNLIASGVSLTFDAGNAAFPALTTTGDTNTGIFFPAADTIAFTEGGAESMRINSSGNLGIGTSSPLSRLDVRAPAGELGRFSISNSGVGYLLVGGGASTTEGLRLSFDNSNGSSNINNFYNAALSFSTNNTERARIDSSGRLLVGKTAASASDVGCELRNTGLGTFTVAEDACLIVNRTVNDGDLVQFWQAGVAEGSISVSGTTVSYNGGHLSRWAQTTSPKDDTLLKGTVLSNLNEMNVYNDADGNPVANEQLNKVKVSDTEGDVNVAGVFVNWSHDEDHNVDEINMAMTGDMIIRIAQGVTVVRGDLLMSAGDGTAKPQGDDIVRSKTVAKVTSNHVTCTYADGSYCVPCVLMAC